MLQALQQALWGDNLHVVCFPCIFENGYDAAATCQDQSLGWSVLCNQYKPKNQHKQQTANSLLATNGLSCLCFAERHCGTSA